ncbi:MAG: hypothetical protein RhofKO_02860 [Rhodothermales bacterium]
MLTLGLPLASQAQALVEPETPLVNQYIADSYQPRSDAWWDALSQQLAAPVQDEAMKVDEASLRNIIFFASHHGDKVTLDDTVLSLVEIYRSHADDRFRMLALVALHAIGDKNGMYRVYQSIKQEPSERVRRLSKAAVKDYYAAL